MMDDSTAELIALLKNTSPSPQTLMRRRGAVHALTRQGSISSRIIETLISVLQDPAHIYAQPDAGDTPDAQYCEMVEMASLALLNTRDARAVKAVIETRLTNSCPFNWPDFGELIGDRGLHSVSAALQSQDPQRRKNAIALLSEIGGVGHERLLQGTAGMPADDLRLLIVRTLAASGSPETFADLLMATDDPISDIRDVAAEGVILIYERMKTDIPGFHVLCRDFLHRTAPDVTTRVILAALTGFSIELRRVAAQIMIQVLPLIDEIIWARMVQPAVQKIAPAYTIATRNDAIGVLRDYPRTRPVSGYDSPTTPIR